MLSPAFWLIFAAAFWLLKSTFDAAGVVDDVRITRRRERGEEGEARRETEIDVLGRAA